MPPAWGRPMQGSDSASTDGPPVSLAAQSEADLVRLAKAQDSDAFGELHRRHVRSVRGFIRARARNDGDADQIEQEMWINVWTHIGAYDPDRAPFVAFAKYWAGI